VAGRIKSIEKYDIGNGIRDFRACSIVNKHKYGNWQHFNVNCANLTLVESVLMKIIHKNGPRSCIVLINNHNFCHHKVQISERKQGEYLKFFPEVAGI
jgi:hypothetical protein